MTTLYKCLRCGLDKCTYEEAKRSGFCKDCNSEEWMLKDNDLNKSEEKNG